MYLVLLCEPSLLAPSCGSAVKMKKESHDKVLTSMDMRYFLDAVFDNNTGKRCVFFLRQSILMSEYYISNYSYIILR